MSFSKFTKKIIGFVYSSLLSFDILGPTPEINFEGEKRYSTFIGVILTFSALTVALIMTSFTISGFYYKTNPDVLQVSNYDDQVLQFNSTSFRFYLNVYKVDMVTFQPIFLDPSEYLKPSVILFKQGRNGSSLTNFGQLENCEENFFNDFSDRQLTTYLLTQEKIKELKVNSLCLPNNANVGLLKNKETIDQLNIYFDYDSFIYLYRKYKGIFISFTYQEVKLNPNNFTDYYSIVWKQELLSIRENFTTLYMLELEDFNITKDQSIFIFSDTIETHLINGKKFYQQLILNKNEFVLDNFNYLTVIELCKATESTEVLIKYKNLNDIFSLLGGSFEIIRILSEFFLHILIHQQYSSTLINKIFKFHSLSSDEFGDDNFYTLKNYKSFFLDNLGILKKTKVKDQTRSGSIKSPNLIPFDRVVVNSIHENIEKFTINNFIANDDRVFSRTKIAEKSSTTLKNDEERVSSMISLLKIKPQSIQRIKISPYQYLSRKLCNLCVESKDFHKKMISQLEKIIEKFTEINSIINVGIELNVMKKLLFTRFERKYIKLPSFNAKSLDSINFLKKFTTLSSNSEDNDDYYIGDLDLLIGSENDQSKKKLLKLFLHYFF